MSKRYPGGIIRKTPQTPSQTSAQGVWDMASVTQAVKENTWPIAGVPDPISKSLRFRSSASAYLNRTGSTATNAKLATYSFWFKRGVLTTGQWIFTGGASGAVTLIGFNGSSDALSVLLTDVSGEGNITTAVFRDPSAWYHFVIAIDTSQATTADRAKIYVNGVLQSVTVANGGIGLNSNWGFNTANTLNIGRYTGGSSYTDGYLAEVNFIDGQALTPSSFGSTNDQTGVWQPIAYTGTYGTNGFYLPFSNTASTSTLGYDFSGNSNNWTTNNISLTSGSTYDSMVDVPTQWIPYNTAGDTGALFRGNYCVLNSLNQNSAITLSAGNLSFTASNNRFTTGTFAVTSGKWYWEFYPVAGGASGVGVGAILATTYVFGTAGFANGAGYTGVGYTSNGSKYISGTSSAYGATYGSGNVIGVALDLDSGTKTITFYKDNTSQGSINLPTSSEAWIVATDYAEAGTHSINFGQRPFSYTPPSGFKTLCTTNLSTPTIGTTASTTANKYFDINLWTGTGTTNVITNSGSMQPDFVWAKRRSSAASHGLVDSVRGTGKTLFSNLTDAEDTGDSNLTAFNSNGFTAGSGGNFNTSGQTYVGWQWRANSGTNVTNTAGSITSTVSANTTAGFSIVTYTGTGVTGTVGHGLGVAPSMIIVKVRSTTNDWCVYHTSIGATQYMYLDSTQAASAGTLWNNTAPTSSVFSASSTGAGVNSNGQTYVAYCWAEIAGFSKFGSYTGNGSSDGPFIYTGFRPRFILTKATSFSTASTVWTIWDTTRSPYNAAVLELYPNSSSAESTDSSGIDILSNGFKPRRNSEYANSNGQTYIYMAFAESPFKYSLAR